jgi:hypothetical protein
MFRRRAATAVLLACSELALLSAACEWTSVVATEYHEVAQPWPDGIAPCDHRAAEICNGRDDDCDGQIDEGPPGAAAGLCADPCRVVQVQQSCALRADGDLFCWGFAIGSGGRDVPAATPVRVPIAEQVVHSRAPCARTVSGQGVCWGAGTGTAGREGDVPIVVADLGYEVAEVVTPPVPHGSPRFLWKWSGVGGFRCARRSGRWPGTVWCWHVYWGGGRGEGPKPAPQQVTALGADVEQIAMGRIICARKSDGSVWCTRDLNDVQHPQPVEPLGRDNVDIAVGGTVCAIKTSGQVACLEPSTAMVTAMDLGSDVVQLAIDTGITCALGRTGSVRCLGGGAVPDAQPYTPRGLEQDVIDVSGGCATKADGSLWCWGDLPGDGTLGRQQDPVAVNVCPERRK